MKLEDRKKLTANEFYLNECVAILDGKIRATGLNFFDEQGKLKPVNYLNIESFNHGTISCVCGKNLIQINWDGTNFNPIFVTKDGGNFVYRLKPLGIEYYYSERKLNEVVFEKIVYRKVGDSSEYYKFLLCGSMTILLEYCAHDEFGKTTVTNTKTKDYSDDELIEYMQEQMQIAEDYERERSEGLTPTEKVMELLEEVSANDMDELDHPVLSSEFSQKELDEIDAYVTDDQGSDIFDIDYSIDNVFLAQYGDAPYNRGNYPDRIEDFDYQKFIKGDDEPYTEVSDVVYSTGPSDDDAKDYDESDPTIDSDYDDADGEDGVYDEEEGSYSETTELESDEFIMDDSHFIVTRDGQAIEGQDRSDIIDDVSEGVMDINNEALTLRDIQFEFMSEIRKMRAIIIKRRELLVKRKAGQSGSDVSDSGNKSDKDISDD
ncbi:MAG: hypothetical protein IKE91_01110 [Clostridia bacterium]|nr:hypothetical protein [Clostridia bacterium]